MQKIVPHLWFDTEAREAAEFYCRVFADSEVSSVTTLTDTPSGDCDVVSFRLCSYEFMAISAGPQFRINPSISFIVNFEGADRAATERLDRTWEELAEGGTELMPLGEYPFSKRYGWIQDRYGVSWQLILSSPEGDPRPGIVPSLMFTSEVCGRAEEAASFYLSVFSDSERGQVARYPEGVEPEEPGTIMYSDFRLHDGWFAAMDSARAHDFGFNEAVSLMVNCDDQAEIDRYWEALSAVPEAEQCGWLKDRFGVSWQVVPAEMGEMMTSGTREQIDRVTQAFLPMKKFDLAELRRAYRGA
jgi:predicted 3-demethylubiquinone-9 3-methyltransferase (glyoxalase superfamily)